MDEESEEEVGEGRREEEEEGEADEEGRTSRRPRGLLDASRSLLGCLFGSVLEASWGVLGASWLSQGLLGASWMPRGSVLGPLGGLLGASWGPLGGLLGPPGRFLGPSWRPSIKTEGGSFFRPPVGAFKWASWGSLGLLGSWGALGALSGALGALLGSWGPLGPLLGPSWALGLLGHLGAILRPQKPIGGENGRGPTTLIPRVLRGVLVFSPHVKWGFCFLSTHVAPASPSPSLPPPSPSGQHSTPLLTHSTHSPAQHGATQRSTPQHSTSHHSTAQHSSADHKWGHILDTIGCAQGVVPEGGRYALCTTVV